MVHPEVLQDFSAEIYLVCISIQKQLIKVAIYEIYGMQWGAMSPRFTWATWAQIYAYEGYNNPQLSKSQKHLHSGLCFFMFF